MNAACLRFALTRFRNNYILMLQHANVNNLEKQFVLNKLPVHQTNCIEVLAQQHGNLKTLKVAQEIKPGGSITKQ